MASGNRVTVNTTTSGCVTNEELNIHIQYGFYDRHYLESVDSSDADKLPDLEEALETKTNDVQVYFSTGLCNESVETAARNDATTVPVKMKMILGSLMGYLSM
ncbi:hypothetical protein HOLleu_24194 [Holothuria leucospilota]|uniref:Uncharacterized protein n=1 Tax=Holothuria leucospilota TaxID=206669 RepID=A0A9Q1BWI0_HOLLE|nr:hypothetical protein HOLleu_24194 [Holothuria leucospilota]